MQVLVVEWGENGPGEGQYGIIRVRFPKAHPSVPVRVLWVAYMVKIRTTGGGGSDATELNWALRDVSHLCVLL